MTEDESPYDVEINFIVPDVVEACYAAVRQKFEALVLAADQLTEVLVIASLALRIYRLALATRSLATAGLIEESQLPFRSATESVVNLL